MHTIEEAEAKIAESEKAFISWSRKSSVARGDILHTMADLLIEHIEPLAELASKEMGKTVPDNPRSSCEIKEKHFKERQCKKEILCYFPSGRCEHHKLGIIKNIPKKKGSHNLMGPFFMVQPNVNVDECLGHLTIIS